MNSAFGQYFLLNGKGRKIKLFSLELFHLNRPKMSFDHIEVVHSIFPAFHRRPLQYHLDLLCTPTTSSIAVQASSTLIVVKLWLEPSFSFGVVSSKLTCEDMN